MGPGRAIEGTTPPRGIGPGRGTDPGMTKRATGAVMTGHRVGSGRRTAAAPRRRLLSPRPLRATMVAVEMIPAMMVETMTVAETTEPIPGGSETEKPPGSRRPGASRHRRILASIRSRLLASFVVVLALAALGSVIVVRGFLLQRLDERINRDLVQEAKELRKLAGGNDPETGEPFGGRVKRIFEVFLERNIP